MPKRPKKMRAKHMFYIRQVNPMTGKISMDKQPHTVLIPREPITIHITSDRVIRSKNLRGRGDSQRCTGSVCVWDERHQIEHDVTGVCDFNYSTVHIQSSNERRECYGYTHSQPWFPKLNDRKDGHDKILEKLKEAGGQIDMELSPITSRPYQGAASRGKKNGSKPRRSPKHRGAHLRAIIGAYGVDAGYQTK
jgi:hypothetical protein